MTSLDFRSLALAALFESLAEVQRAAEGEPLASGALSREREGEPLASGALSREREGEPLASEALSREREGEPLASGALSRESTGEPLAGIQHLLEPLFAIDADHVSTVFAPPARYSNGVRTAGNAIAGERKALRLLNYALAVMELASLLKRQDRITQQLSQRLRALADAPRDAGLLLALDEAYQETIGKLGKRIQVSGDRAALGQPQVAARIRALLLAAVRFAWLWQQLGGRRWHLIVGRRKTLAALDALRGKLA